MLLSKLLVCHLPIEELGLMGRVNRARFHSKDDTNKIQIQVGSNTMNVIRGLPAANTQKFEVPTLSPFNQLLYLWLTWQYGGLHHHWLSTAESKDMFTFGFLPPEPSWHWGHTLVKWCMSVGWMEVGWGCTVSYELVADGGHSLASSSMARTCPSTPASGQLAPSSQWAILCRGSACEKLFCPEQNTGKRTFQKTFAYSIMGQWVHRRSGFLYIAVCFWSRLTMTTLLVSFNVQDPA